MGIQNWSDEITVVELSDDPQFTDDLSGLIETLAEAPRDVVLNFAAVGFVNSSNLSLLLRLRKAVLSAQRRIVVCDVNSQVWGIFVVTGLEKIFEFTSDIATALATLQLAGAADADLQDSPDRQ